MDLGETDAADLIPPPLKQIEQLLALINRLHAAGAADRPAQLAEALLQLLDARHVTAWTQSGDLPFEPMADAGQPGGEAPWALILEDQRLSALQRQAMTDNPLVQTWQETHLPGYCLISYCCLADERASLIVAWRREEAFDERQRSILHLIHPQVHWALERETPPTTDLAPGTHAVLELMLTGIPEREIAQRLGRSVHTVHSHIKRVYRHYEVSSRPALLLRFFGKVAESAPRDGDKVRG